MAQNTKIEWCDKSWNPVTGCSPISPGCDHCYAEAMHRRFNKRPFSDVICHEDRLAQPLRMKKPTRIFVNSMSDLFHPDVPISFVAQVFNTMASWRCTARTSPEQPHEHEHDEICLVDPGHTYFILTKRPERALRILTHDLPCEVANNWSGDSAIGSCMEVGCWPLSHVWIGVTVEDQVRADERYPPMKALHDAGFHDLFISNEPALASIDWRPWMPIIRWAICGGETGRNGRPMRPDWPRSLRDECVAAQVPFFFKHWGEWVAPDHPEFYAPPNRAIAHVQSEGPVLTMTRVGKKRTGRLLDGREWNEMPEPK